MEGVPGIENMRTPSMNTCESTPLLLMKINSINENPPGPPEFGRNEGGGALSSGIQA
jgi:hypothetical protein